MQKISYKNGHDQTILLPAPYIETNQNENQSKKNRKKGTIQWYIDSINAMPRMIVKTLYIEVYARIDYIKKKVKGGEKNTCAARC